MADLRRCRELQSLMGRVAPAHQGRARGGAKNPAAEEAAGLNSIWLRSEPLGLREVQLHADAIRIVEKKLRVAGARHDALAEFDALGLQALAHAVDVGGGKGDVVEPAGIFVLFLGAAHDDSLTWLARAHQVYGR